MHINSIFRRISLRFDVFFARTNLQYWMNVFVIFFVILSPHFIFSFCEQTFRFWSVVNSHRTMADLITGEAFALMFRVSPIDFLGWKRCILRFRLPDTNHFCVLQRNWFSTFVATLWLKWNSCRQICLFGYNSRCGRLFSYIISFT